ncbi:hypothetical protein FIV41_20450 [Pseudomonas marginalis]|uniref:Uncharacterized protein n=1 Tax=Pseudomonas marginalis TaxID=298 RepID=A0A9X9BRS2_PSEMA|nr:hypothetical protein FIV41_20450 [Pseudomonas marginalis]
MSRQFTHADLTEAADGKKLGCVIPRLFSALEWRVSECTNSFEFTHGLRLGIVAGTLHCVQVRLHYMLCLQKAFAKPGTI